MKNVERVPPPVMPSFRVPIHGAPPLRGWAVRYVSGMEQEAETKPGFWLSRWETNSARNEAVFNFEPQLVMCYDTESEAAAISGALRKHAEIETEVVKI